MNNKENKDTESGIYSIENMVNGKLYIGSAVNIKARFRGHKSGLRNGYHENGHLQRAWNKYGEDSFKFNIIIRCDKERLIFCEQKEIDAHDYSSLYNISPTAGNCSGCVHSKAVRAKMGESKKGKIPWNKGMKGVLPKEIRLKMSESRIGTTLSEEIKQKISKSLKGRVSPKKGKPSSIETRRKISERLKGNSYHKGIPHSEETRSKMRAAHNRPSYYQKLTPEQVLEIRTTARVNGYNRKELSLKYGLNPNTVLKICKGTLWPNVGGLPCLPI